MMTRRLWLLIRSMVRAMGCLSSGKLSQLGLGAKFRRKSVSQVEQSMALLRVYKTMLRGKRNTAFRTPSDFSNIIPLNSFPFRGKV